MKLLVLSVLVLSLAACEEACPANDVGPVFRVELLLPNGVPPDLTIVLEEETKTVTWTPPAPSQASSAGCEVASTTTVLCAFGEQAGGVEGTFRASAAGYETIEEDLEWECRATPNQYSFTLQ